MFSHLLSFGCDASEGSSDAIVKGLTAVPADAAPTLSAVLFAGISRSATETSTSEGGAHWVVTSFR